MILEKVKYKIIRKFIELNFREKNTNIRLEKKEKIMDFYDFLNKMIYKDENWNYIKNLKEYLNSIYYNKRIEMIDNDTELKKYEIKDNKLIANTGKIDNNWNCYYLKKYIPKNYELNYDFIVNSEFEEVQIAFRYKDLGNRYRFMVRNNKEVVFECVYHGIFYNKIIKKDFKFDLGKKYNFKLIVLDNNFFFYINDELIYSIKEYKKMVDGSDILLIFYNKDDKRNVSYEISNFEIFYIEKK